MVSRCRWVAVAVIMSLTLGCTVEHNVRDGMSAGDAEQAFRDAVPILLGDAIPYPQTRVSASCAIPFTTQDDLGFPQIDGRGVLTAIFGLSDVSMIEAIDVEGIPISTTVSGSRASVRLDGSGPAENVEISMIYEAERWRLDC